MTNLKAARYFSYSAAIIAFQCPETRTLPGTEMRLHLNFVLSFMPVPVGQTYWRWVDRFLCQRCRDLI